VRIISGSFRGRRINPPKGLPVRPTTDFAKEGLFDILGNLIDFEVLTVLDLFAGTGNISIEFISRGAIDVTAVDMNPRCISFISETAKKLGTDNLFPVRADVFRFVRSSLKTWDVIFADPPYDLDSTDRLPAMILDSGILKEDGLFILEHSKNHDFSETPGFDRTRRYGNVNFSFFRVKKEGH
jgi:16S rRNA (guanine(966)-N(2))-methyltransferase RsmD